MDPSSIYITLPSSASLGLYPHNTLAHYKTELATPIVLNKDDYEIGLAEFQLNANIYNIEKDYDVMTVLRGMRDVDQMLRLRHEETGTMKYESLKKTEYFTPEAKFLGPIEFIDYDKNTPPDPKGYRMASVDGLRYFTTSISISKGYYSNIRSIIDVLNKTMQNNLITCDLRFILDEKTDDSSNSIVELVSIYGLSINTRDKMLIYHAPWFDYGVSRWKVSKHDFQIKYIFDYKRLIDIPVIAYVYLNIIEFQYVGDVKAQVIRAVHMEKNKGALSITYENPHYVRLNRSEIKTIEAYIRDTNGKLIQFDRGSLSIKLHIRKTIE